MKIKDEYYSLNKICEWHGKKMIRAIYWGFPMWICQAEDGPCVEGFWSIIVEWMPNPSGVFIFYPYRDNYFKALLRYIKGVDHA